MEVHEFFDKAKETTSDMIGKAKDTTARLANIADLKSKISSRKNEKNKLFTQMGMDYYLAQKKDQTSEEKLEIGISKIDDLDLEIQKLNEKLALLQKEK